MASASNCVAVTGATGFIGGHTARRLAESRQVLALARSVPARPVFNLAESHIEWIQGDLLVSSSVDRFVRGANHVIHCASDTQFEDPARVHRTIVEGSATLFEAARRASVECFVFLSTFDVYYGALDCSADEDFPLSKFGDIYADAKIEAEALLRKASEQPGSPRLAILRLPAVLGPGSKRWCRELARLDGRPASMPLPGGGEFSLPYMAVDNLIDALTITLDSRISGTFNLLDDRRPYREIACALAKRTGGKTPTIPFWVVRVASLLTELQLRLGWRSWSVLSAARTRAMTRKRRLFASATKFQDATGWRPRVTLEQVVQSTAEWLETTGRLRGAVSRVNGSRGEQIGS